MYPALASCFSDSGAPLEHPLKLILKFQIASFSFLGCLG
jgi:hypothetical protein